MVISREGRRALARGVVAVPLVTAGLAFVSAPEVVSGAPVDATSTTTAVPSPSTTIPIGSPSSSTTTTPPRSTSTTASRGVPTTTTGAGPPALILPPGPGARGGSVVDPHATPADALAVINSVRRSRPNDTRRLLEALRPLEAYGVTLREAAVIGSGHFPVAGLATFTDDWLTPRFTPTFHLHEATDVFAERGTPVRAPADGVLTTLDEPVGGIDDVLTQADHTWFFFAHLQARTGQANGSFVHSGDVIGWVGDTGDATGTPHLHFEIHPRGGGPVNPKPYLDAWLIEAEQAAPGLIARFARNQLLAVMATGLTRGLDLGMFAAPFGPSASTMLWTSSVSPGGALQYAAREAERLAETVDWSATG